jgi:hypothetical protein
MALSCEAETIAGISVPFVSVSVRERPLPMIDCYSAQTWFHAAPNGIFGAIAA